MTDYFNDITSIEIVHEENQTKLILRGGGDIPGAIDWLMKQDKETLEGLQKYAAYGLYRKLCKEATYTINLSHYAEADYGPSITHSYPDDPRPLTLVEPDSDEIEKAA